MKNKKLGTFTLAITMIMLGIILLISNFMHIDINKTVKILSAVSIILIGAEFLFFDWYYKRKQLTMELKVSVVSVVLLIIIYSSSFIVSGIYMYSDDSVNGFRKIFSITDEYEVTKDYTEDATNITNIQIDNTRGNIEVQGTDTEDILITAILNISTIEEQEKAIALADDTVSIDRKMDNTLTIRTKNNIINKRDTYINVSYKIQVPKDIEVNITNGFGDTYVSQINKETTIKSNNGDIQINSIGDELSIENDFGSIVVESVAGSAKIKSKNGDIEAEYIGGDLDIKNSFGKTTFDNISGNVTIDQKQGDIEGNNIGKNIEVEGQQSSVEIDDVKGVVNIKSNYGYITAKNVNSDIELYNENGDISLEKINGNIEVNSKYGDIDIDNYNIIINKIDIENENGSVNIDIPNDQKGVFKLRTNHGTINSKFNFDVQGDDIEKVVQETIGNSESTITIDAHMGDIFIN
jgi:hypothetical protein